MKDRLGLFVFSFLAASVCAAPFKDGDRVVFYGDSITHHGRYHELISLYYATRFPDKNIRLFNAGESGGSAGSAMRRLADDVASRNPTQVAVMFGMNDIGRNNWPRTGCTSNHVQKQTASIENFKRTTTALVAKVRETCANPGIIYITPSPFDQSCLIDGQPADIVCNDGLASLGNWVRRRAGEEKATCVDLQTFLRDMNQREQLKDPTWSFMRLGTGGFDRVHPRPFGHQFFAYQFLKAQGAPAEVAHLAFEAKVGLSHESRNVKISDFTATPTGLSFTALEKALPYPFDDQTVKACDYVPFNRELNRETFRVVSLEPGLYELTIDGVAVGRWTTQDLSAGVNLATNGKTPQYAQAQKVRELNAAQWKEQIKGRDVRMWRLWKKGSDVPVEDLAQYREWFLKKYPGGKAEGFFGYMAKQYLDYADKLADVDATCDRLYAEVRAAAQPVPHKWVLTRVGDEPRVTCSSATTVDNHAPSLLPNGKKWKLVWNDEFDGTELDTTQWGFRTNFWGRNAHWFAKPEDGAVEVKDGCVHLKIVKKPDGQFVSPQLQTGELLWDIPADPNAKGFWPLPKRQPAKFLHKYGYYEARFRLQKMPGWWSAFWMQTETQGCSLDPTQVGIEQDIMESFYPGEIILHCYHMNGYGPDYKGFDSVRRYKNVKDALRVYQKTVGTDQFVTMGLLWEPEGYTVFINGEQSGHRVGGAPGEAVSNIPEFILLSTECKYFREKKMTGAASPDLEAAWKAGDAFAVDYVRVYDWE